MGDYFNFRKMVSSLLIKLIYIIGLISITVYGFYLVFNEQLVNGLLTLILGNIIWRVTCEGIIIIFSIHDRLASIERRNDPAFNRISQY